MLLYNSQVSGNCFKVRLLLAHLGIAYERREVDVVDRSDRRELLGELNPALRIPTLVLDDGSVFSGDEEILAALDRRFPEPAEAVRHREKAVEEWPEWLRLSSPR